MRAATSPRQNPAKLLVVNARGDVSHHAATELALLVGPGDLVVGNDAATLPASLAGVHERSGERIEVRLAGRHSLSSRDVTTFTAVLFGGGDYRVATEARAAPPPTRVGDCLLLGLLRARVTRTHDHPRLIDVSFDEPPAEFWEGLAHHGRPIQYSYVRQPLAIWDTWTSIASQPAAFEAPSAGFILTWSMLRHLRARGTSFATVTHAAGISSTGDPDLDRQLPLDEPYVIPAETGRLIAHAREAGRHVIAIGTTVVRALEHAASEDGRVVAGPGVATGRIGSATRLRIVDALVSGVHEAGTSHYELLGAFQHDDVLARMTREADACDYETHEFGDAVFIARAAGRLSLQHPETTAA